AGERFARVPLALRNVDEALRSVPVPQALEELEGQLLLRRAEGGRIPLGGVEIVRSDERGLAPHRQAHVTCRKIGVDLSTELRDFGPLLFGVWLGYKRHFDDPRNAHLVLEVGLADIDETAHRCRERRLRRTCQRKMPLASE